MSKAPLHLPCRSVAHAEHEDNDNQELVKVPENSEDNLENIASSKRAVFRDRERIGKNVECEVDVGLYTDA
jgi:hypothetical protein